MINNEKKNVHIFFSTKIQQLYIEYMRKKKKMQHTFMHALIGITITTM